MVGDGLRRPRWKPNLRHLYYHFNNVGEAFHKNKNVFASNWRLFGLDRHVLLVDIDCKDAALHQNAHEIANHVNSTYLQGQGMMERSSSGTGFHIYFIVPASTSKPAIEALMAQIVADPYVESKTVRNAAGRIVVGFDFIYGIPTEYDHEASKIIYRGNVIRLPRFENDWDEVLEWSESMVFLNEPIGQSIPELKAFVSKSRSSQSKFKVKCGDIDFAAIKAEGDRFLAKRQFINHLERGGLEICTANLDHIIDLYCTHIRLGGGRQDDDAEKFGWLVVHHRPSTGVKPQIVFKGVASAFPENFNIRHGKNRITYADLVELDKAVEHVIKPDG